MSDQKNQYKKLHELLLETIKRDQELREKYKIGEKFRFIRDRLNSLKSQIDQNLAKMEEVKKEERREEPGPDETFVYVYLFNAQGLNLKSWQPMLSQRVFYEYSINRPIYAEKSQMEAYLRTKTNKNQNGFLTFIIKKADILPQVEPARDTINNPLIKVKEGSLKMENFLVLTTNNADYVLSAEGEIIKKVPST